MDIISWNVNGLRAAVRKGFLDFLRDRSPDILCIQEIKVSMDQLDEKIRNPDGYHLSLNSADRRGYSGVAAYTKKEPLSVKNGLGNPKFDSEGRVQILSYPDFTLFNVYFPNGKKSQERLDYKLDFYDYFLDYLEKKHGHRRVIVCGDVNTAHKEIDLARPKENEKISGFLPEERAWIDKFISKGYVDTFRHFNKEPGQYTWWSLRTAARKRNVGWRLDYFFISEDLLPALKSAFIMQEIKGSDHCPVGIEIKEKIEGFRPE